MDFLCFKANHGKQFAILLTDAVSIIADPVVTHVPGTNRSVSGMTKYLDELIAIVDVSIAFSGESENGKTVIVVNGKDHFGIKVEEISGIVRNQLPFDCALIDVKDFEKNILTGKHLEENDVDFF